MSGIVTFYSYKGGVGRSMALANIALLLARRNLRVLTVDWDLEAPGLERYFSYFDVKPGGPGLLRLCMEARRGAPSITGSSPRLLTSRLRMPSRC
jgi:Mrp family chromosome partitioning ATPase